MLNSKRIPLFFLALALLLGILLAESLTFDLRPAALCLLAGLSGLLLLQKQWLGRSHEYLLTGLLALATFGLGNSLYHSHGPHRLADLEGMNCRELKLGGVVSAPIRPNDYGRRTELQLFAYAHPADGIQPLRARVMLFLPQELSLPLQQDDTLWVKAYLSNVQSPFPGYRRWLRRRGISHQAYAKSAWAGGPKPGLQSLAHRLQSRLSRRLSHLIPDPKTAGIAQAMLLGSKEDLDPELKQDFATAGLSHILAISGLHIGIIFLLLNLLFRPLQLLPGGSRLKQLLILGSLMAYLLLSGAMPAVVRATLMFGSILIFRLGRRRYYLLNVLGISAIIQMLVSPAVVFSVGFQLSYVAVVGIVLLYPAFERWVKTPWMVLNQLYGWIGVSLTASLFTAPLVAWYFGQFPTWFLLSNVLASLLAFLAVFLGFLTVLFAYVPGLAEGLAYLSSLALKGLQEVSSWVADLPGALITDFSWDEKGWYYLLLELAVACLLLRLPWLARKGRRLWKKDKEQAMLPSEAKRKEAFISPTP
jgi:ComEC/Rec2-related protein